MSVSEIDDKLPNQITDNDAKILKKVQNKHKIFKK